MERGGEGRVMGRERMMRAGERRRIEKGRGRVMTAE